MDLNTLSCVNILDGIMDGVYFVDTNRTIFYWNKGAERISGYTAEDVIGNGCHENLLNHTDDSGRELCRTLCPLAATMLDGMPRQDQVYLHHKLGHRVPVSVRTGVLRDGLGQVVGGVEFFSDISNSKANELRVQELERMALLDDLTQLANRRFCEMKLQSRFEEYRRMGIRFGVFFMDIDHFKQVNDTWGHDIGDRILQLVARTFTNNSRPFDMYGRWGGEEFIGIIRSVDETQLKALGERLRVLVEQAYLEHEGQRLRVTISLGATLVHPDDAMISLVKRVDDLLYASKEQGRNRLTFG